MATPQTLTAREVLMPRLSDSMTEGTISAWVVADGEEVTRGQEIVEIDTDKATVAYEAPATGTLRILAVEGETVAIGEAIARIETSETSATAETGDTRATGDSSKTSDAATVSPVARRLAERHGIDLGSLTGTGPGGRILKRDILQAVNAPAAPAPTPEPSAERRALTRTQLLTARRMTESRSTVPHFTVRMQVHAGALGELRASLAGTPEPGPTANDIILFAVSRALGSHPLINGAYVEEQFELHPQVNLGFAVAADHELLVPVIHGADQLALTALATEARRLADQARAGTLRPQELSGGTFTVSNLGMFGVASFDPIINAPQAAILGVGGIDRKSNAMELTLVSDHRIVYGSHAALFLADLRKLLENPLWLLARG